jgi:hypothetical protein
MPLKGSGGQCYEIATHRGERERERERKREDLCVSVCVNVCLLPSDGDMYFEHIRWHQNSVIGFEYHKHMHLVILQKVVGIAS